MFGVTISTRRPRNLTDYQVVRAQTCAVLDVAGVLMNVENNRETPVYLKWRT